MISKLTGRPEAVIATDSRLAHDLGLAGDDAAELLSEFCARYGIAMSDIEFNKYFPPEAVWFVPFWHLSSWQQKQLEAKEPLTVGQLVAAARRRRWTEP